MLIEEVIKQCEENEAVGIIEIDTKQLATWLRELMQLRYNNAKTDYDEVRGRLQTANLIKDEQKAKADKLLSCLKCLL
jgi:carbamoylphosphate synthase small subunit